MSNGDPFVFLVDTLFSIYIAIMYLRFILQQVGADFYNPISQFIMKATQPLVKNARRIIPAIGRIDTASIVLTFLLIIIKILLIYIISGFPLNYIQIFLLSLRDLITLTFNIFIFAIFIQALLSWVNPDPYNPISSILNRITYPIQQPISRWIPPMGGIDLSSLVALIGLMFLKLLVLKFF